ncbi:6-phosphofructo-2-kinase-domain-containing protein [Phascolomyces articulosus]|uniref:fructose-2,6-bisphosphate 2-phosphatase n=1 Tax=Phascolomyces articulosus TaxID=60185 RepID=A0AAD5KNE8_9FUNG|nr:6-phosphofructo-2-kinase-domain-containing protein [Phascolomyces articulosus]
MSSFNLRIACVMVGLPARGKTYISQKVCRYLTWLGIKTKVFNVGNYRRKLHGASLPHTFFDPHNPIGEQHRKEAAAAALEDMLGWFDNEQGIVAIYDATNSTYQRRKWLHEELTKQDILVLFIESICQDESLILNNIKDVKLSSPDYVNMDPDAAAVDFRARIDHYQELYQTITEEDFTYIKLINVGSQVIINMIQGYLESRIIYYLMNLHIAPRKIYFSRHGESMYNVHGKIGGDSELSPRGKLYGTKLPGLIRENLGDQSLTVWTSTMKRTIQTGELLPYPKLTWKALDELDAGVCDGMTYEEIEEKFPEDFANRDEDKFNYRYRGGESYRDVVLRLEPVIMALERHENILIIGHQAILRCIYAYFMNYNHEDLPYIKIPLHTVIELTPKAYGCEEKRFKVDIEAVDTHRPKPAKIVHPTPSINTSVSGNGEKLSLKLPAGASGEIVKDALSPILPISPKLHPRGVAIKDGGKPGGLGGTTTTIRKPPPPTNPHAAPSKTEETEMAALDLGDAAVPTLDQKKP